MSANMDIQRCYRVLEQANLEYDGKEEYITVHSTPKVIVHSPMTALWAQSSEGEKKIDMKHGPLRVYLKALAGHGPGQAGTYDGVTYCFVCKLFPRFPDGYPVPEAARKPQQPDNTLDDQEA